MNIPAVAQQDYAPQIQAHQPAGDLVGTTADRGIQTRPSRYTQEERELIRALAGDDQISDGDIDMLNKVASRSGLDPFLKEIYLVGRKTKTGGYRGEPVKYETKWTIQTGIDGFRSTSKRYADARGEAMHISAPTFYDDQGNERKIWLKSWGYPAAAQITVTIGKSSADNIVTWDQYAQVKDEWVNGKKTGKSSPNSMWEQFGPTMLAKCAEAGAHRRVCPLSASVYIVEEMQQATQDERAFRHETIRVTAERTGHVDDAMAAVTAALSRTAQEPAQDVETVQDAQESIQDESAPQAATQDISEVMEIDADGYPANITTGDADEDLRLFQIINDIKTQPTLDGLSNIYSALHPTFDQPHAAALIAALTRRKEQLGQA